MNLKNLIAAARGDMPADLVLANARIVNTFTGEIEEGNVAVHQGRIAGVGDYTSAKKTVDLKGRYLSPGLIDGHVHIESSYLHVDQYARAVVPHGTLAVVTDLHEVANVCGLEGMRYIMECGRKLPLDIFFMSPSCVPATDMETSGARLGSAELRQTMRWGGVIGLGEMMNFPGVINASDDVVDKIRAVGGHTKDGHAPRVRGKALNAYMASLIGSDHETISYEEGLEKLRRGMRLMIREGSTEKNLEELLPLVTDGNYHRCMLVVDDRNAKDLVHDGDLDAVVRKAIRLGLDPVRAIQMATLNTAIWFKLDGYGGIGPGYWANMLVLDDLESFKIHQVYYRGELVAQDGKALFKQTLLPKPDMMRTVNIKPFDVKKLALKAELRDSFPVIEIVPGQIVTKRLEVKARRQNGTIVPDVERDLLKLVVVERHRATGNIGVGLVKGFGLKKGALASTFAHDSHNVIVVGTNDQDIYRAVKEVERNQGGLAVVADAKVLGSLPLPIAGLLSPEPLEKVAATLEELERLAAGLGCKAPSPFSVLSFMALPVIPELKLTDMGLVDVTRAQFIKVG